MRVGLDATPLLGHRTGVGRYVESLVAAFAADPDGPAVTLTAFTWRGAEPLRPVPGASVSGRRAPARLLQLGWQHLGLPRVELLSGPVDVFHATNFVLPPTRRAAGVVTIHDLSFLHHADTVTAATLRYRQLVPLSLRRADVICTVTEAVAEEIRAEYGVERDRVVVTRLGVDAEWLSVEQPDVTWLSANGLPERYLLFVGTREPRKNLPVLLDSLAVLHAADPATPPLVLVGPTGWGAAPDHSHLPSGAVVVPGFLDHPDLRRVVAGAAALVQPSRYEGFGLPPLEALACGTPVIASDIPQLREVLGRHATFVPVGDRDGLAQAITSALVDGDGGATARAARRAHAGQFTWDRCAAQTLAAYQQALR